MVRTPRPGVVFLLAAALALAACADDDVAPVHAEIGSPLPGLSPAETARFEAGRALFRRRFTPADGLGPRFNEDACNACHTFPFDGGTGETSVTKRTAFDADERCDLLVHRGGENVRIQVTAEAAALGAAPLRTVEGASHSAVFSIPFTFGLGLVDAIPIETLEAMADPDDTDGNGISGRVGRDGRGRPARFGRKADVASLADFTDNALRLEMGLTTPAHPDEALAGGTPAVPDGADPVPEPEVDGATVTALVDFMRFLAPPSPAPDTGEADVARGRDLFRTLGCVDCHVPRLRAGPSDSPAIAGQAIALYSDLLLHDMGPALESTCGPGAATTEYRTEPLMGLRHRRRFLHDGRATRVMDAILLHGGEAQGARDRFSALDRLTQEAVLRYLATL